jgi:hypothetical protein
MMMRPRRPLKSDILVAHESRCFDKNKYYNAKNRVKEVDTELRSDVLLQARGLMQYARALDKQARTLVHNTLSARSDN